MSSTPPQTEKPFHYTYLKEFRVNQCPLFLQHKCTQHRPFTCFHWHFSNQRRRRPVRKRDGTFNYCADVYCSRYDETTGICPDGDDCPYIHRNTGDTERRYHLRYYKTGTCIHETDSKGNCVKNGPHCAFAHGAHDLRPPVYDIREQQMNEQAQQNQGMQSHEQSPQDTINLAEKIVNDDPKWQDANYVLANYKTELCKRPPRLCRQGYACPQYHNAKDRRRNPKKYKYRSSPCPNVKQGDDWKDPTCCEKGDSCQFCHTRTEQQFHPEIYKSTKCHDMTQTGYCPRGPFCAFAHVEQEIRIVEESASLPSNVAGSFGQMDAFGGFSDARDQANVFGNAMSMEPSSLDRATPDGAASVWGKFSQPSFGLDNSDYSRSMPSQSMLADYHVNKNFPTCPSPISKPRTTSLSNGKGDGYSKAPGSERSLTDNASFSLGVAPTTSLPWITTSNQSPSSLRIRDGNSLNSDATPFYPPDETVDSVVGNALDELDLDDHKNDDKGDFGNLSSHVWSHPTPTREQRAGLFAMSDPVNIPQDSSLSGSVPRNPMSSISPSSLSNALGTVDISHPGAISSLPYTSAQFPAMPPQVGTPGSFTGSTMSASLGSGLASAFDLERMHHKCKQWEDSWNQAKIACDAWKREATEANERARISEDRNNMTAERCRLLQQQLQAAFEEKNSNDAKQTCLFLHQSCAREELAKLPLTSLKELQTKYKNDLETVEKVIWELLWQPQN